VTEAEFRSLVVKMLAPLAAFPVENLVDDGTPDICCSVGWIETKLGESPKRDVSRVAIKVRDSQRTWHRRWRRTGAKSLTLTLVDDVEWYLHDGNKINDLGNMSLSDMRITAFTWWSRQPEPSELVRSLLQFADRRTG